jgi:hypothetical protein
MGWGVREKAASIDTPRDRYSRINKASAAHNTFFTFDIRIAERFRVPLFRAVSSEGG